MLRECLSSFSITRIPPPRKNTPSLADPSVKTSTSGLFSFFMVSSTAFFSSSGASALDIPSPNVAQQIKISGTCHEPRANPVKESFDPTEDSTSTTLARISSQRTVDKTSSGSPETASISGQFFTQGAHNSISKAPITFDLDDNTLNPDTQLLPPRVCSYDTLI
ncbi:hypothetical protein ElyMa_004407100 [Elysia marginata]|uniref:Uncharacterized protein n=1 Tax=Elysia marginata TaxID=1093978 RepID=A0AAV4HAM0_9GAST|nr:hypothetical protein ElyMa_004407100 [Elysia marginata]